MERPQTTAERHRKSRLDAAIPTSQKKEAGVKVCTANACNCTLLSLFSAVGGTVCAQVLPQVLNIDISSSLIVLSALIFVDLFSGMSDSTKACNSRWSLCKDRAE